MRVENRMFEIDDVLPRITTIKEFESKIKPLYVIDEYAYSKAAYKEFKRQLTTIAIGAFHRGDMMVHPVQFKFYKDDKKTHTLEFRAFLYNVFLWYPMVELQGIHVFDESSILTTDKIPKVNSEISRISLKPLTDNSVEKTKIGSYAADIVYDLQSIGVYFGLIMALHFDNGHIFKMYDEYGDLLHPKDYSGMQPDEIEEENKKNEKELIRRILADGPDNPFHQITAGGNPFKTKQLRELLMSVSLRPTLDGDVVTKPINNGLIMGALKNPSDKYIDGLAARKPALVNNKDMGDIGYFIKALNILTKTLEVSRHVLDCGTLHLVEYDVKDNDHLMLLAGKYMDDGNDDLRMVKETDTHLIGKKIRVRSAVTCCCGQNEVCATCIGDAITYNWDIAEGFATFITEEYSKDIEQNSLSTKHLIHPIPEIIEFNEFFSDWFELRGDEIYLKDGLTNNKDYAIYIDPEETFKFEEFDDDSTYNNYIDSGKFFIENLKNEERIEIAIKNNKKFFIRTETFALIKDGYVMLKDLAEDIPVFEISISNNDATLPFKEIMGLLDLENKKLDDVSIEGICNRMLDLFVDANLKLAIAAAEMALNRICRKPGDVHTRPNFSGIQLPPYQFYSVGKCNEENESVTVGMIYEQLQRQMSRLDLEKRQAPSFVDPFFMEKVYMDPILDQIREEEEDDDDE